MARIRSIAPEACESRTLAQLSDFEERAWWRLLTHMDDQGRGKDDALLLCSKAFAVMRHVDEGMVEAALATYARLRLIIRYEVDGQRYLQVRSWPKHQHPKEPGRVRIPPPPNWHIVDREWVEVDPPESKETPDPPQDRPRPGPDPTQTSADPGVLEVGGGSGELGVGRLSSSPPTTSTGEPPSSTGTTTTEPEQEARTACSILAKQDLDRRRAEKPDGAPPPSEPARTESWLVKATEARWERNGPDACRLAAQGLDGAAIAARLRGEPPALAVVRPDLEPIPKPDIEPDRELNVTSLRRGREALRGQP